MDIHEIGSRIKSKLSFGISEIAGPNSSSVIFFDANGDGIVDKLDGKEYAQLFGKVYIPVVSIYASIAGISDPSLLSWPLLVILTMFSFLLTVVLSFVIRVFKKEQNRNKRYLVALDGVVKENGGLREEISILRERLHTLEVYKEFQDRVFQQLYSMQNADSELVKRIVRELLSSGSWSDGTSSLSRSSESGENRKE